jgi:hypothetical protein
MLGFGILSYNYWSTRAADGTMTFEWFGAERDGSRQGDLGSKVLRTPPVC